MENYNSNFLAFIASTCLLLLLTITMAPATTARILDKELPPPSPTVSPADSDPVASVPATITAPVAATPATATAPAASPTVAPEASDTVTAPTATTAGPPVVSPAASPASGAATTAGPPVVSPAASPASGAATTAAGGDDHTLSFFMHDILGGTNPSARIVTGIVTNTAVNGQLPFAKPNGAVLPVNNGIPLNDANSGIVNNNNIPFLTGLGGATNAVIQNNGNGANTGNTNNLPFFTGGNLPAGATLQKLLFGTMTVIDDELTEGHELGSGVVGKAQGFYVASSEEGTSQTMAFTAMFKSGEYADSISFFGVHRTAESESHVAVVGGTGKFVNAKGYATVATLHSADLHETDGIESVLQFTVYLSY